MTSDHPLEPLARTMAELARASDDLRGALDQGTDYRRIRALLDQARALRAQVGQANPRGGAAPPAGAETSRLMAQLQDDVRRVRLGEQAAAAWLQRPLSPSPALLADRDGVALLVDQLLPAGWNPRRDIALIVGQGGRLLIEELLSRGQQRVLVLVAPDADTADLAGLTPAPTVVHDADQARRAFADRPDAPADQVITLTLPALPSSAASPTPPLAVVGAVRAAVLDAVGGNRIKHNTLDVFGHAWVLHGLANLPHIARWPSVSALRAGFAGKPMVIVAPGPSLHKNIQLLHRLKGRAIIVALNRSVQALHHAGITPDLVIVVDPSDLRYHFDGVELSRIGAFIVSATVFPGLLELPLRRLFSYAGNSDIDDWIFQPLGENEKLPSGGSVACSAFSLGLMCGCDPIILVGQDLAFTGDQIYDRTTSDGGMQVQAAPGADTFVAVGMSDGLRRLRGALARPTIEPERIEQVRGAAGGTVRTSHSLKLVLRWFEGAARDANQAGRSRLWNCTEGGAFIDGFAHLTMAEAIDRLPDAPLDVEALLDDATARTDRPARLRIMQAQVRAMRQALEPCADLARRGSALAEQAQQTPALLPALGELEQSLIRSLGPVRFISIMAQDQIRDALVKSAEATTLTGSLAASRRLFTIIEDGAALIRGPLQAAEAQLDQLLSDRAAR